MRENIDVKKSRFRDASWFELIDKITTPVVIGGAGGIGSWLTLFLSRINLAGQLYRIGDIRENKAVATSHIVKEFSGYTKVHPQREKYIESSLFGPIMFSAFDNMEARKVMFNNWRREIVVGNEDNIVFIDGRLLAEQYQVFCVTDKTADEYEEKHLFNDSEVEDANCSYKQTTHFAASCAATMVQVFTQWLMRHNKHNMPVPFYYEEIGSLFLTHIEYGAVESIV
jgi:hypothetical protein